MIAKDGHLLNYYRCYINYQLFKMTFELQTKTIKWLTLLQVIANNDYKQLSPSTFEIKEHVAKLMENGVKVSLIVQEIFKKKGVPTPATLNHLKLSSQTAAQLYNWNILNDALKKLEFQVDSETKNLIINGDRQHLAMILRKLQNLYEESEEDGLEDSLETEKAQVQLQKLNIKANEKLHEPLENAMRDSLSLSRSEEPPKISFNKDKTRDQLIHIDKMRMNLQTPMKNALINQSNEGDLLEYVVNELQRCLKLTRKQSVALLSDNNKYLAHVLVKGIKGQFAQIEQLMERWYANTDSIVQKMIEQNDMCFFYLQVVKPSLLSKSEEIAQWGCRILSKIAYELANKEMLPLAYDWFVREAGGLSTTILALSRHPKLNQHVVSFILQFARYNVTELFTIQLRKITNNDNLAYMKFMLLIFDHLVESKLSSEELLSSGAIDYWVETCLKGCEGLVQNSIELRLYCMEFLTKMWRAYPIHIEETLDKVNEIMGFIKKGTRQDSEIMRFTLVELLFSLLDQFASKKNPYASIVYKKLTFLFIETHEELTVREFMLRNFAQVFNKYQSIPVEIFLEPFVKQIKTRESKSYFVNIFDMEFINVVVNHKKLKVNIGLELFDLLAKTKLNSFSFATFADQAMTVLLDRFLEEDIFFQYAVKLVKISLAMFYSTLKHKKQMDDNERLNAQKRAEIINFVISLVERNNNDLNEEIKTLVIHVKLQIQNRLNTTHKGIERILSMFVNIQEAITEAIHNIRDQTQSNIASQNSKTSFQLPKIQGRHKYLQNKDQVASQQSFQSNNTKYSQSSKKQFPIKQYTRFAQEEEKKFLQENGIGLKKKNKEKKVYSAEKVQPIDPKIQQQLEKIKTQKEEQIKKKLREKQILERKKQNLKNKIQKQLDQRNLMQGIKGNQRDVETKVIFQQNEINEKLFGDEVDQICKNIQISEEQNRDSESIKLVLKKSYNFIKKIFTKYSCAKINKKQYFQSQSDTMAQIDLIRFCKEKNVQKNKASILELLRNCNQKNTKNLSIDGFFRFLQALCIYTFVKDKYSSHYPMGDLMKNLLKKIAAGENIKLEDDEDQQSRLLSEKVKYNPHIELPQNYKKIYERVYDPKRQCSYPTKKAVNHQNYIACYEVVNDLLFKIFSVHLIQEEVRFHEEARVINKKIVVLPPRSNKKDLKQENHPISLLQDKEIAPGPLLKNKRTVSNLNKPPVPNRNQLNLSLQKLEKQNSKPKLKALNAVQKKKIEQEEIKRQKKLQEQEIYKQRQLETKKKFEKLQEEKQREKSLKKDEDKLIREAEQDKRKKQKEQKQKYLKIQKQKVQKYKREQDEKEKQEKQQIKEKNKKQEQQKKQKYRFQMKKEEEKRKDEAEKMKKQRQISEDKNKRKKQQQEKKKQVLKKQVLKKLEGEKQRYEITKLYKELVKKVFLEGDTQNLLNSYKDELKGLFNYGKQSNQFKLGDMNAQNQLEQKGWMMVCQQMNLCDNATANSYLKNIQKEKGRSGFTYEQFLEVLLNIAVKKQIENQLEDYQKAHQACLIKMDKFLKNLKMPKEKQDLKDFFVILKNNQKKREEIQVQNPQGEKQNWQIQQK